MIIQIADQIMNNREMKSGNSLNIKVSYRGPTLFLIISVSTLIQFVDHTFSTEALIWAARTRQRREAGEMSYQDFDMHRRETLF